MVKYNYEKDYIFIINLTCPLQWIGDGAYPTSASFKDLYFVTLNDEEIKIDNILPDQSLYIIYIELLV